MIKKILLAGFVTLDLVCAPLFADPLVLIPQGDFSCTVEVTPHDVPKPDPAHPERKYSPTLKRVAITRVGKIQRDYFLWSDNTVSQLWDLTDQGASLLESNKGDKDVYYLRGRMRDTASPRLLHFDADSVSWITSDALAKDSGPVLHYTAKVSLPADPPPPRIVLYQAWIDPKTLLPIKFDDGDALYALTFAAPAPGPLVLPPEIQAELDRWKDAYAPHPHR